MSKKSAARIDRRPIPMPVLLSFLLCIFIAWPEYAGACNGSCDAQEILLYTVPAALGTTILAPLLGLAADSKEHSPYLPALLFTALASAGGVAVAASVYESRWSDAKTATVMVGVPVVFGTAATVLVYQFWRRSKNAEAKTSNLLSPQFVVSPSSGGGHVGLTWHF